MWSLHVFPVYGWVLSGYSGFLPLSKNMHRLIGVSKIVLRSECEHVCGCLSLLSLCGPLMDWRPVQGVPPLTPDDRLQPPCDQTDGLSGYRKWMVTYVYVHAFGRLLITYFKARERPKYLISTVCICAFRSKQILLWVKKSCI